MKSILRWALRLIAVGVPVAAGLLAISYFRSIPVEAQVKQNTPGPMPVRVFAVGPLDVIPRVAGYGVIRPAREWRAVARLDGEVTWTSDRLANGLIVDSGAELLRIDDTATRLSLAQIDAQIAASQVKDTTTEASLVIARQDLALAEAERKRQEDLNARGVATKAAVDQARRQALSAEANVNNLKNQLALNAAERDVLKSQRAIAARDLTFTSFAAPYPVRIGEVQAQAGQYVTRGQTLFTAEGIDKVEASAQFPIGRLGPLMREGAPGDRTRRSWTSRRSFG